VGEDAPYYGSGVLVRQGASFVRGGVACVIMGSGEHRLEQALAAVESARGAGVGSLVVISILHAELTDTLMGREYYALEMAARRSGVPWTILRCASFTENLWQQLHSVQVCVCVCVRVCVCVCV
jgi:uncharacterized protein YbjT (DUF2867 family)